MRCKKKGLAGGIFLCLMLRSQREEAGKRRRENEEVQIERMCLRRQMCPDVQPHSKMEELDPSRKPHITLAEARAGVRGGLGLRFEGGGETMEANEPGLLALVYTMVRREGTVEERYTVAVIMQVPRKGSECYPTVWCARWQTLHG